MGFAEFKAIEERVSTYEASGSHNLISHLPILVRFDGSSFSTFTKGLKQPFDQRLTDLIIKCTEFIVDFTNAKCGFCGSDEITIVLWEENIESQTMYNGRVSKILSELPSRLSVKFNKLLPLYLPEKIDTEPYFDARTFNVPTLEEACNCFWVREESITKNAITMAALSMYSHSELEKKSGKVKNEMMFQKGVNFNDYPADFKRGTYIQKRKVVRKYSSEEIEKLPLKHKARFDPDLVVERGVITKLDMPVFSKVKNKVDVIFHGADPIV